jgi:hypothetical protein
VDLPANMVTQAVIFCSFQPCIRHAEGDLVYHDGTQEQSVPICARHYEFVQQEMRKRGDYVVDPNGDVRMLSREILFADELQDPDLVDFVIDEGEPYTIIE